MLGRDDEGRVRDALTRGGAALVTDWNGAWYATLDAGSLGVLGVFGFPLWPDETSCAGANLR